MEYSTAIKMISVVIPCRNEEHYIAKCIESILNQDYHNEYLEILVVDGMSDDSTTEIIKSYASKYPMVRLLVNEKKVAPVAMNIGIKNALGEIIIIFGAHAYMEKDYVSRCAANLESDEVYCVGGKIINMSENETAEVISQAMSSKFGVGNALFRYSDKREFVDTVAFGAYKRMVFDRIGFFDEEFVRNQDDELNFRLIQNGMKILLDPQIVSYYYTRGSFSKLWRQYYQYGFWKVRVIQKHKKPASIRHLIPVLFVLGLIIGGILSLFVPPLRVVYCSIIVLYLLAAFYFAGKAAGRRAKHLLNIMKAFGILHISYGLGFIEGIYHFYMHKGNSKVTKNTKMSR